LSNEENGMGFCEKGNFVIGAEVVHYFLCVCAIGKAILARAPMEINIYSS